MKDSYRTIPVRPTTWRRLMDYKMGEATFDDVLNELMDNVPIEVFSKKLIEEHNRRLRTFEGRSWRKVKDEIEAR
jgi:predicted CopG family antitoxin